MSDQSPQQEISEPLASKKGRGKVYATLKEKIVDFVIGFGGWYIVNGMIWGLLLTGLQSLVFFGLLSWPVNIFVLIILAFRRRWMALGGLVAISLNLVILLTMQLSYNVICSTPFFIPLR